MVWSYQQLVTFHTVARTHNMTTAARDLGYTTGAVSQQISQLEASIGTPLFMRLPRGLTLSDRGEHFLNVTSRIISAYQGAIAAFEDPDSRNPVLLRLGVFTSATVAYLPTVLKHLAATHPHILVHSTEVGIRSSIPSLTNGTIDASLTVRYPNIPNPQAAGLSVTVLDREPFSILCSAEAPLSAIELNRLPWILPPEETPFGKSIRQALHTAGIAPRVTHTLENHVAAMSLARAGLGITAVTNTTLGLSAGHGFLHPFPGSPAREIVFQALEGAVNRPSLRALEQAITQVVAECSPAQDGSASLVK